MRLIDRFREIFLNVEGEAATLVFDVEHLAERAETDVLSAAHQAEEFTVAELPQVVQDALARIKALLSSNSDQSTADAQTISNLNSQVETLTDAGNAKDQQIADLKQQLADAQDQLTQVESALLALSPDPNAPAPTPGA